MSDHQQSLYADFLKDASDTPRRLTHIAIQACFKCQKEINSLTNDAFVCFTGCGHQFHTTCIHSYLHACPNCNPLPEQTLYSVEPLAPALDDNVTAQNTAIVVEKDIERPFVFMPKEKPYCNRNKAPSDALAKLIKQSKHLKSFKFDAVFLKQNGTSIVFFEENGVQLTFDDIYHVLGIVNWADLVEFGYSLSDLLKGGTLPIEKLVAYYQIDYWTLKNQFKKALQHRHKETMLDFLARHRFSTTELVNLGLTFKHLLAEGLTRRHLIQWNLVHYISWHKHMGATKEDFLVGLLFKDTDVKAVGWDVFQFADYFQLTKEELSAYCGTKWSIPSIKKYINK